MVSLEPGLQAMSTEFNLLPEAFSGCPIGFAPLYDVAGAESPFAADCANSVRLGYERIAAASPDVIIWHDLQSVLARRDNGQLLVPGSEQWTTVVHREWRERLADFLATGAEVVLVMPPLRSVDAAGTCPASLTPERCSDIQAQDETIQAVTRSFWAEVESIRGVHQLDVDDLLCPRGNPCPGMIDGIQVRIEGWDQTHFTDAGASWFAPQLIGRVRSLTPDVPWAQK